MKMKNRIKTLGLLLIALCISVGTWAQEVREDVVYLKNGTVYRGMVIEQVFGESLTIETNDGKTIKVAIGEVAKITKEPKVAKEAPIAAPPAPAAPQNPPAQSSEQVYEPHRGRHERPPFHYRVRRGFFQAEVMGGIAELGLRLTGGYQFGQFGRLGIGVGADGLLTDVTSGTDAFRGSYFPIYLHYSGDMLHKRVTPFYLIEAGYAFRSSKPDSYISITGMDHAHYDNCGGLMGTVGIGLRLYSNHRVYGTWALVLDVKQAHNEYSNSYIDSQGQYISVSYSSSKVLFMPGVKLGIGF